MESMPTAIEELLKTINEELSKTISKKLGLKTKQSGQFHERNGAERYFYRRKWRFMPLKFHVSKVQFKRFPKLSLTFL